MILPRAGESRYGKIPCRRIWWIKLMRKLGWPNIKLKGWRRRRAFDRRYEREPEFRATLDALYDAQWER